jgi:hypothetical protein
VVDTPLTEPPAVPTSLDEVLNQAQMDFVSAIAMDEKRLRLDILVPGLNEQVCEVPRS